MSILLKGRHEGRWKWGHTVPFPDGNTYLILRPWLAGRPAAVAVHLPPRTATSPSPRPKG